MNWEQYAEKKEGEDWEQFAETPTSSPTSQIPTTPTQRFLTQVGKGMIDVPRGLKQLDLQLRGVLGITPPEEAEKYKQFLTGEQKAYEQVKGEGFPWGELVGGAAVTAPIPGGVGGGILKRILTGGLAGGASAALSPELKGESRFEKGILGGIAGAGTAGGLGAVSKGINAVREPASNFIQDLANKYGIRTTLGEITQNPYIQRGEKILDYLPFIGLGKFRSKQNEEASKAAKSFLASYIVDPNSPDIMATNRAFVSRQYETMKAMLPGVENPRILPAKTRDAARELLSRFPSIFKKFEDVKREQLLQEILSDTENIGRMTPITFDEAWTLREGLGKMIGQARKKLAAGDVDETAYGQIKGLFGAISDDIDEWANRIKKPEISEAFKAANDAYKNYVVKYDIIRRAYDKASGVVGAGEMFSPKQLSTAFKNIAYKDKELKKFAPNEIDEMVGLANILQVVKKSGQIMEDVPTGNRWGLPALGAIAGVQGTAQAIPFIMFGKFLTSTESGKRIAMAASRIEPDNPIMGMLVKHLYNQIPKWSALGITENMTPTKVQEYEMQGEQK